MHIVTKRHILVLPISLNSSKWMWKLHDWESLSTYFQIIDCPYYSRTCYALRQSSWAIHSYLPTNETSFRRSPSLPGGVFVPNVGTFLFGNVHEIGKRGPKIQFLPVGSTQWQQGKTSIIHFCWQTMHFCKFEGLGPNKSTSLQTFIVHLTVCHSHDFSII